MWEWLVKIVACIPRYLVDFGAAFSGPKRFIAQRNTNTEESLSESLVFLGISVALTAIMSAPLVVSDDNFFILVARSLIVVLLGVSLMAGVLRFAWRLVGGAASVRSFFVTYAYFTGITVTMSTAIILLANGVFKIVDPQLYRTVREAQAAGKPIPNVPESLAYVMLTILLFWFIAVSAWGFASWGAYRQLNGLSRGRSFIALLITGLLGWVVGIIVFFIGAAMG